MSTILPFPSSPHWAPTITTHDMITLLPSLVRSRAVPGKRFVFDYLGSALARLARHPFAGRACTATQERTPAVLKLDFRRSKRRAPAKRPLNLRNHRQSTAGAALSLHNRPLA